MYYCIVDFIMYNSYCRIRRTLGGKGQAGLLRKKIFFYGFPIALCTIPIAELEKRCEYLKTKI